MAYSVERNGLLLSLHIIIFSEQLPNNLSLGFTTTLIFNYGG